MLLVEFFAEALEALEALETFGVIRRKFVYGAACARLFTYRSARI